MMGSVDTYMAQAEAELSDIEKEITELQRRREIAQVRLETLQMVAGKESPPPARTTNRTPAVTSKVIHQARSRAPSGAWKAAFAYLLKQGLKQFSYEDVLKAATDLAINPDKGSVRVRVSKFKDQGYLERVSEGVYKPTKAGSEFFKG